jgi:hypothetical protein
MKDGKCTIINALFVASNAASATMQYPSGIGKRPDRTASYSGIVHVESCVDPATSSDEWQKNPHPRPRTAQKQTYQEG